MKTSNRASTLDLNTNSKIARAEQLVYTFNFEAMPGHEALETVTFEEHGCKTRLTDKLFFQTVEDRDGMLDSGMETGVTETMDRFAEPLKEMQKESAITKTSSSTEREITVTRIFDAPRELVWKAWGPTARGNMRQGWNNLLTSSEKPCDS